MTGAFVAISTVAHLLNHVVLGGDLGEFRRFPYGPRQRLLAVDMFAPRHGPHGRHAVPMVGSGDGDGVDIVGLLVEHFLELFIPPGLLV